MQDFQTIKSKRNESPKREYEITWIFQSNYNFLSIPIRPNLIITHTL